MKETISPDYAEDLIRRHHSRHSLFEETVDEVNQEISRERLRETELPALVVKRPRLPLPSERARAAAILKSSNQLYLPPVGRRTFPTERGILPKIDTGLHKNNVNPPRHDSFGIDKNVSRQNQDQRNDLPRIAPGLGKLKIPLNQLKTGSSKTETYLEKYQRKKLNAQSKTDSGLDKQTVPQVKRESKINGELRVKRAVCRPVKLPVHSKTDSGLKRVPRPPPALLPKLESGSKNPAPYLPKRPTVPETDSYLKTRNSGHRQVKSKIDTGLGRTKPTCKGNGSKEEACTDLRKTQELDRENTKSADSYSSGTSDLDVYYKQRLKEMDEFLESIKENNMKCKEEISDTMNKIREKELKCSELVEKAKKNHLRFVLLQGEIEEQKYRDCVKK